MHLGRLAETEDAKRIVAACDGIGAFVKDVLNDMTVTGSSESCHTIINRPGYLPRCSASASKLCKVSGRHEGSAQCGNFVFVRLVFRDVDICA